MRTLWNRRAAKRYSFGNSIADRPSSSCRTHGMWPAPVSLKTPDSQQSPPPRQASLIRSVIPTANEFPARKCSLASGYGSSPEDAARTTRELIQAGVAGMNLEDGSSDPARPLIGFELAIEKIKAARAAAVEMRAQIVINARTDVYLLPGGNPDADYSEALRRLLAFRDAGADCVFAPGLKDAETIGRLAKAVECPLNILAGVGTPSIAELAALGVARVSVGSGPIRATLGLLRRIAEELKGSGTYTAMEGAIHYAEVNKLLGG